MGVVNGEKGWGEARGRLTLVGYPEYVPCCFVLLLALVRRRLGVFHLVGKVQERVLDLVEALWRGLLGAAGVSDGRHGSVGVV